MMLSIFIVNWNVREALRSCLASIAANKGNVPAEVIVADNNSSDGSVDMVRSEFPWVMVLAMNKNLGFARANNRALAHASGAYVLFLNPDTSVQPGALATLVGYLEQHASVAMVAPKLVNADGSFQYGSVRRNPTLGAMLIILLKLQHLMPASRLLREYYFADFAHEEEQEVDQVMGAAMCVRRSTLDRYGFFDEKFFLWFEEVDLCLRFRKAGEKIVYVPSARITHLGGQSFKQQLPLVKQRIYNRSALHFFMKHHGILASVPLLLAMLVNLLLAGFYQLLVSHGNKVR